MKRRWAVLSSALFSCTAVMTACSSDGIDAVFDCGAEHIYVDCDQDIESGSVSGFVGVNSVAFSCNVPKPQTGTIVTTPDRSVVIEARIDYPVVGPQGTRATLLTFTGDCGQVAPERQNAFGTITIEEFEPRSHVRGTFESAYGKLHGTFDLKCGEGNVFCGTVATTTPKPPNPPNPPSG